MAIIPSDRKNTNHSSHTKIKIHRPDSKQFIVLNHCQARDLRKLDFAFNASPASVNIAKVVRIRYYPNLSIGLLKHSMCNIHMLKRILAQIGIRANRTLNAKFVKELFGLVADAA